MRQASVVFMSAPLLGLPRPAWAQPSTPWEFWGMHPMWGMWGIGMMLFMLVFWGEIDREEFLARKRDL